MPSAGAKASSRKRFFFEKKNQKTLRIRLRSLLENRSRIIRSFLLLFFKKEVLSRLSVCLAPCHRPHACLPPERSKEILGSYKKRSKKLLSIWLRPFPIGSVQTRRSFLVLFFKKEHAVYIRGGRSAGKSPSGAGKPMSGASGPGRSVPGGDAGMGSGPTGGTRSGTCRRIIHSPPIRHSGAVPGRSCRTHRLRREKCSMVPPRLVGRAAPSARRCRAERFSRRDNSRE